MIRLVASDLDGTLMGGDQVISRRVRHAIARIQRRGITITLATGRMFCATRPFAISLGITAPLLCYQGGWIQAPGGDVLHRVPLPHQLADEAIALGRAYHWHTVLYADGTIYIEEAKYEPEFYAQLLGPDATVVPSFAAILASHQPDKVLYVADPEAIPGMGEKLRNRFSPAAEVVRSHAMFIEILPQSVNKGNALAWLAQYLDVPREEVLAIGDQENDIPMLEWAGIGVAVGNAMPAVKDVANWIAPPVEEDGAAEALERFVLGQEVV